MGGRVGDKAQIKLKVEESDFKRGTNIANPSQRSLILRGERTEEGSSDFSDQSGPLGRKKTSGSKPSTRETSGAGSITMGKWGGRC